MKEQQQERRYRRRANDKWLVRLYKVSTLFVTALIVAFAIGCDEARKLAINLFL